MGVGQGGRLLKEHMVWRGGVDNLYQESKALGGESRSPGREFQEIYLLRRGARQAGCV